MPVEKIIQIVHALLKLLDEPLTADELDYLFRVSLMSSRQSEIDLSERSQGSIYEKLVNIFLDLPKGNEVRQWFVSASWNEIAMVVFQANNYPARVRNSA